MKCPIDQAELVMSDRQGIEIDYCPQCRGVWLDRGELDKIIQRSADAPPPDRGKTARDDERRDDRDRGYEDDRPRRRRRESFLGDLFDFD